MALISSGMSCPVCEKPISDAALEAGQYVATSHFIGDPTHPLWMFSDAAIHQKCFDIWTHREAFIDLYNEVAGRWQRADGASNYMLGTGAVILRTKI